MSLACSRSSLARPYICRLMSFRRVICPSVWPLDHGETMGTRFRVERAAQGDVVVTARPLELSAIHAGAGALALFLAHPGSEAHTDPQLLRALLGLTMAEARLAAVLCEGLSLVEAAQRLGIAHNTAKVQLRAVFAKTGVRRQAQLVALMGSLGLGFAGAGFEAGADGEQTNARDGLLTFC